MKDVRVIEIVCPWCGHQLTAKWIRWDSQETVLYVPPTAHQCPDEKRLHRDF